MASEKRTTDEGRRPQPENPTSFISSSLPIISDVVCSGGGLFGSIPAGGAQPAATQYKVVVVGDGGTGKTAWLAKLLGNDFPTTYRPTIGVAVRSVDEESLRFSMSDCAGQEQFGGLRDGHYIGGQAAVIFFDLGSHDSFANVANWYEAIVRVCGNVPIVVVGAKCDLAERMVAPETVAQFVEAHGLEYVEVSAKEDTNTRKPLELLTARLTNATSAEAEERTTTSQSGGSLGSAPTTEWSWPSSVANTSASTSSGGSSLFDSPAADGGSGAQPAAVTQYKVVVAGDGGTGKTAWLAKLLGNDFPATYNPTLGVAVQSIDEESLRFSMWDCAGQERFGGLREGYFIGGQAAVIFFDLSSPITFSHASSWYRDIARVCGDIPTIVVGAKCDLAGRVVASGTVPQFVESHGLEYVELSAKQDINTRKPLELLAAKLINAKSAATPQSGGSLFGLAPATAPASPGFSWPSEPKREPEVDPDFGLFGRGGLTPSTSGGGGGLFGTSTTGGDFPAPTSGGGGGLFGTSSTTGGGFPAPTSGGGGGLFGTSSTTGGSQLGGTPASGLFGNSGGGGDFSNTSAPTPTGGGGLFTGGSLFGSSPDDGSGAQPEVTQYKVVVAGDGGTGKTAWLAKLLGNDFPTTYNPTLGVAVRSIDEESIRFSMWDCAGQEQFSGLRDGYFIGAQAAVIFFDLSSRFTFSQASRWYRDVARVCGDVPTIVVGAKCDLTEKVVPAETVPQFVERYGLEYVELSAKEDINTRRPLELLAAKLTKATSAK